MEVKNIPLVRIHTSPLNPRKTIDEGDLQDLSNNIKQQGLLQPITVRPIEADDTKPLCGEFEIICGERRYRAVSMLEEDTIPCIVREMTDEEALDAMITENLQRKDVDPIEEAFAFGQLLKTGKTVEQIADRFGKSKRFVQERIKLDNLLPDLKKMVKDGKLHIGAAMHVCKLTEDEQRQFLDWCKHEDEISKRDAEKFTNDLFMEIDHADWEKDFEGSCGTTCDKCPFNNCNVGCLFYEMKPHDASCTNREWWNAKRVSWLLHIIEENADVLVKADGSLETGKTVVVAEPMNYWQDKNPEYEPLLKRIKEMGFKVCKKEDYFERYSFYREDDERLQEKIANNEVYRVLSIDPSWRGTEIEIRYYELKKNGTQQSDPEVQAMQLVNEHKANERRKEVAVAKKLRDILEDMKPEELSKEPLSNTENLVLMTLLLRNCSYELRQSSGVTTICKTGTPALDYVKSHTGEVYAICRDFIREELSNSGIELYRDLQECQSMILQEWAGEQVKDAVSDLEAKFAERQADVEAKLTALGYNADGTKMAF